MSTASTTSWYSRTQSNGQALIADDETGRTVAVCYDAADGPTLAAAPNLRRLLEKVRNYYGDGLDDNDAQEMALHREIACALSDLEGGAK